VVHTYSPTKRLPGSFSFPGRQANVSSSWPPFSTSILVQNNEQQDVYIPAERCELTL